MHPLISDAASNNIDGLDARMRHLAEILNRLIQMTRLKVGVRRAPLAKISQIA